METKKGGDLICKRPETIIEARFSLTKRQNDILDMVFATISDDDNLKYQIDVKKYGQLYNIKEKSKVYGYLKKAVRTFEGKGFAITSLTSRGKEDRIYFSWFSSIHYIDRDGTIEIEIGQKLKAVMLSAKKACFYQLRYSLNFHNIYSKRIYYYLKSFENSNKDGTGWRIDNLNELRTKLECPKSYNVFYEFKRYVLKEAQEEINGNCDIEFNFEEIKTKGKVTSIKFYIKSNKIKSVADEEVSVTKERTPNDDLIKQVQAICHKHNITDNEALCMLNDANNDLGLIKERYEYLLTQKDVGNVVGYMRSIIVTYDKAQKNIKIDNFNNFEQREYDYDKLEKHLLGWQK